MSRMTWFPIYEGTVTTNVTSKAFWITNGQAFSIIVDNTSAGANYDISYECAIVDTDTFATPIDNMIMDNVEGDAADQFSPIAIPYVRFVITNNSGSPITLRARFVMQEGL